MTEEQISEGAGFSLYHLSHILWIFGIFGGIAIFTWRFRYLNELQQRKCLHGIAWILLWMECIKTGVLLWNGTFRVSYLPLDLCGLSIFLELAAVYKRYPLLLELVYSLSLPGACLALLFPNWNALPIWNYMCLHSFLLHGLLVLLPVLLLSVGELRPNWRRLPLCFTCLCAACIPIALINDWLGTNFFFLARPSKGSPLVWFEQMFGNYLIGFPVLIALIWMGMYGISWFIRRKKLRMKKHL